MRMTNGKKNRYWTIVMLLLLAFTNEHDHERDEKGQICHSEACQGVQIVLVAIQEVLRCRNRVTGAVGQVAVLE